MSSVEYFGYGATSEPAIMAGILGVPEDSLAQRGFPAVLDDYELTVQNLDHVPSQQIEELGNVSAREIIAKNWGDDFESYGLRARKGGKVSGMVWELTPEERERIRDWELIDFGWFVDCTGVAKTADGEQVAVVTEKLLGEQPIDRVVNGLDYETYLNDPEDFKRMATRAHREYNERNGLSSPRNHLS